MYGATIKTEFVYSEYKIGSDVKQPCKNKIHVCKWITLCYI